MKKKFGRQTRHLKEFIELYPTSLVPFSPLGVLAYNSDSPPPSLKSECLKNLTLSSVLYNCNIVSPLDVHITHIIKAYNYKTQI